MARSRRNLALEFTKLSKKERDDLLCILQTKYPDLTLEQLPFLRYVFVQRFLREHVDPCQVHGILKLARIRAVFGAAITKETKQRIRAYEKYAKLPPVRFR